MAKKHEVPEGTVAVHIPADLVLTYGDWSLPVADASPATLAYCLRNGFHQSMVDAAAFGKADKEGKTDAEIAEMTREARQTRYDNIVAGTVGARVGGPRKVGIEAITADVAETFAIKALVAKGRAVPKRGKGYAEAMRNIVALAMKNPAFAERVNAEAKRQFAEQADLPDIGDDIAAA